MKLPHDAIDNVGISPDVRIGDEVKDKIQFIVEYYEKQFYRSAPDSPSPH